ncbi:MAG: hypothetical protein ACOYO1_03600 [Bacteroidales bacterium]
MKAVFLTSLEIKIYWLLIFSFCLIGCTKKSLVKEEKQYMKKLPEVSIKNPELNQALDVIINFEKKCNNKYDSIYFDLSVYNNDFVFHTNYNFDLVLSLPLLGCFKYHGYYVFVSMANDNSFFNDWFQFSNKLISFPYDANKEFEIDDTWPNTVFNYNNGKLKFKKRFDKCE